MKALPLKYQDTKELHDLNSLNQSRITAKKLMALAKAHQVARAKNDGYKMALIEYRLDDAGYYTERTSLRNAQYDEFSEALQCRISDECVEYIVISHDAEDSWYRFNTMVKAINYAAMLYKHHGGEQAFTVVTDNEAKSTPQRTMGGRVIVAEFIAYK